jgi:hypothetical protein
MWWIEQRHTDEHSTTFCKIRIVAPTGLLTHLPVHLEPPLPLARLPRCRLETMPSAHVSVSSHARV